MKLRVLHVVHDFLFGGIEAFLFYLTQAQRKNPLLEIEILCCQQEEKISNRRIPSTGIKIHYIKVGAWDPNLINYYKVVRLCNQYDIVHVHFFKPLLALALQYSSARIIYTAHSSGEERREKSRSDLFKETLLVRFLNKRVNAIANNSSYTRTYWQNKGVHHKDNRVIYNGVYFNKMVDSHRAFKENPSLYGKFIIGTTSRFIGWKRVDLLIHAFQLFQRDKDDVVLLLVGDGAQKEQLQYLSEQLGLQAKVLFTGFKTSVADYQSIMHVCVFPSASEPFGLVAVECLHLGKPVFVFEDGGGITELISNIEKKNIVNGLDALVSAFEEEYHKYCSGEADAMQQKRIQYSEQFNVSSCEKQYFELYKNLQPS